MVERRRERAPLGGRPAADLDPFEKGVPPCPRPPRQRLAVPARAPLGGEVGRGVRLADVGDADRHPERAVGRQAEAEDGAAGVDRGARRDAGQDAAVLAPDREGGDRAVEAGGEVDRGGGRATAEAVVRREPADPCCRSGRPTRRSGRSSRRRRRMRDTRSGWGSGRRRNRFGSSPSGRPRYRSRARPGSGPASPAPAYERTGRPGTGTAVNAARSGMIGMLPRFAHPAPLSRVSAKPLTVGSSYR